MTAHERERLAAWLDGELEPHERAEVEAHLAACAECAGLLAEMEGVDEAVRAMPVDGPAGYFDQLPGRVRSRLESENATRATVTPAPLHGRVPVWTWAAAAALLLAVITPLTLHRLDRAAPSSLEAAAPTRRDARPQSGALMEEDRDEALPAHAVGDRESQARRETEPESPPEEGGEGPRPAFATAPAPEPVDVGAARSREALAAGAKEGPPPADAVSVETTRPKAETPLLLEEAPEEAVAPPGRSSPLGEEERAGRDAVGAVAAAPPLKESAAAARVQDRHEGYGAGQRKALSEDSRAFARLARGTPSGAAAWRERREAWRSFLDTHPGSRLADEARVRMIEAGLQAWKAGADPEDLARARDDARAYLARDDARQEDRIRRVLAEIEGG